MPAPLLNRPSARRRWPCVVGLAARWSWIRRPHKQQTQERRRRLLATLVFFVAAIDIVDVLVVLVFLILQQHVDLLKSLDNFFASENRV